MQDQRLPFHHRLREPLSCMRRFCLLQPRSLCLFRSAIHLEKLSCVALLDMATSFSSNDQVGHLHMRCLCSMANIRLAMPNVHRAGLLMCSRLHSLRSCMHNDMPSPQDLGILLLSLSVCQISPVQAKKWQSPCRARHLVHLNSSARVCVVSQHLSFAEGHACYPKHMQPTSSARSVVVYKGKGSGTHLVMLWQFARGLPSSYLLNFRDILSRPCQHLIGGHKVIGGTNHISHSF